MPPPTRARENERQADVPHSLYRPIFEYSPDALLVVDAGGRITLANHQAEVLFGYDRDELTGLFNRRAFVELTNQMLKTAYRRKEPVALFMLNLDHFKRINDTYGHAEGDHVLKRVAETLVATARDTDIVARHGGEEFVIALLGIDDAESRVVAERIRAAVEAIDDTRARITTSIGIAAYMPQAEKHDASQLLDRLLSQADAALYAAKRAGRNRVCHARDLPPAT